jgi:epoxyqueuosine reductase
MATTEITQRIKEAARRLGFDVIGITSAEPLVRDNEAFTEWRESGFAAEMNYMLRKTDLHANPQILVPAASSIITLAINYYVPAPPFMHKNRYGRVARYAWGLDYHDAVKARLLEFAAHIEKIAGREIHARCFVDAVPLLERAVAARAGLGFFGKNTNLLQPQSGSWFFLAEILLDLELPVENRKAQISCGTCHRCIDACPTDAFAAPYKLDSRRCISYLTIENKSGIPHNLRAGLGEWIFGCDVCQEMQPEATKHGSLPVIVRGKTELVCPFNRFAQETAWPEFHPEAGTGQKLDLVELLSIETDERFRARFKGTPLARPKRRGLLRNAAVVAANIECVSAVPVLAERIRSDAEPLIRSHSLWALARLDRAEGLRMAESSLSDPDPSVRHEALLILEQ